MTSTPTPVFGLTPAAAARINALTAGGEFAGKMLRLSINPGGCSGFEYAYEFIAAPTPDDEVFEKDGARLVVDATSLDLLRGAQLDFESGLMGSMFVVKNPNATSGCGCGNSFGVS
jgi:iron-sulfur cluster insertion protein